MAFTVSDITSQEAIDTTSHVISLPDGSNVIGKRVVAILGIDGLPGTVTWPIGWSQVDAQSTLDTNGYIAYRDIDGTEGFTGTGDTITVTSANAEQSNHHSYLVDGHDATTAPESSNAVNPAGDLPDPPSLTPSWGPEENLWIAVAVARFGFTFSSPPTNYTNLLALSGGDANAPLGSARRILNAISEDPDSFGGGTNSRWVVFTVAIRPGEGGGSSVADSHIDLIVTELVTAGHMTGTDTVTDGERKRLLSDLVLAEPQGSMMDLYELAGEDPRIWGY